MVNLYEKHEILKLFFYDGLSQRAISRQLKISRTTVRKYVKEYESRLNELPKANDKEEVIAAIDSMTEAPKYNSQNRHRSVLTDEVIQLIEDCLAENIKKRQTGKSKQVMKNIDIHEQLEDLGYDISYSTVCGYIRGRVNNKEAYIRQEYGLGETLEFDWGDVKLSIDGKEKALNLGLFTTAKGSCHFGGLYQNKKMENFLDLHVNTFNSIGGVHKEIVYDNMKQAVKRFVGLYEKEATDDLVKLSMYYGFRYRFCNVKRGNEKGHVEKGIDFVRRKVFSKRDTFCSIEEANNYLQEELNKLNSKKRKWLENKSPMETLKNEMPYLIPVKPSYDIARRVQARVNKYSVISIDQNRYSVPDYLVGKFVDARIYSNVIKIDFKGNTVSTHKRSYNCHEWVIDINHFIHTLKKKPGALHNSTGRYQMCPELKTIYQQYYTSKPKDFILLLEIIKDKNLEDVIKAVDKLSKIKKSIVTTENIKSLVYSSPHIEYKQSVGTIESASYELIMDISNAFKIKQ